MEWDKWTNLPSSQLAYCENCDRILHIKHSCEYMSVYFDTGMIRNTAKWNMTNREYTRYMIESAKRDGRQIATPEGEIFGAKKVGVKEDI